MTPLSRLKNWIPKEAAAPFCPAALREDVPVNSGATFWRRFMRYCGLGLFISVGYMDPGNWATDIEAGSRFGYKLLCVVLASSLTGIFLQCLCVRLGIATGKDLAQLCRIHYGHRTRIALWLLAEISIIATDFAEVLGTALALKLLFGIRLSIGIPLTVFDTVIVLMMQRKAFLNLKIIMLLLVLTIATVFAAELAFSSPDWHSVLRGFLPGGLTTGNKESWLIAVGIIGATVMPHNLYLHSSIVGTRRIANNRAAKKDAIRLLSYDTFFTLVLAFFVNAAILVMSGAVFHASDYNGVTEIDDAYHLLSPLLGTSLATLLFGIGLLASGQSSTFTGTIAGQVILDGFLNIRIPCWQRRLITRALALVPAWIAIEIMGDAKLGGLLVLSQVILSLQLPFAIFPLLIFSSRRDIMKGWTISPWQKITGWGLGLLLAGANIFLIIQLL